MNMDLKIENGNQRNTLENMLYGHYYCSWDILRENILAERHSVAGFLDKIDKCETVRDIHKLVSNYI